MEVRIGGPSVSRTPRSSDRLTSVLGGLVTSAAKVTDASSRVEDEEYLVDKETCDVVLYCMWQLAKEVLVVKTRMARILMTIAPLFS